MQSQDQFLRRASLIVQNVSGNGIELGALRFRFFVRASDFSAPNILEARVYNLSNTTVSKIIGQGSGTFNPNASSAALSKVTVQAGYQQGRYAVIFQGDVKLYRVGRESNIDTYLDILAGDGDIAHNYAVVNTTLPSAEEGGSTKGDELDTSIQALKDQGAQGGYVFNSGLYTVEPNLRSRPMFGMAKAYMNSTTTQTDTSWSIQNGQIVVLERKGYLPSDTLNINVSTGMIGQPEQTSEGIKVRILLNPSLKVGQLIRINNGDVNQTVLREAFGPAFGQQQFVAPLSADGTYRVLVVDHHGDTRGNQWYSDLTCLAFDSSAPTIAATDTSVGRTTQEHSF